MSIMIKVSKLRINGSCDSDLAYLEKSIRDHGLIDPILVDHDNIVVDGVRRVCACINLGIQEVPAIRVHG